ncbi:DNA methyltransferase [Luteitalea sp.]|uniref:DNA methyltransferase n=1 Tax=Luteitalea sp. TaxID=2004800 RepID=UPI0025C2DD30|nr:DNA methyltransferase [Luteitalea sp.]
MLQFKVDLKDEVFGSDNFVAEIAFKSTDPLGQTGLPKAYDYIIWYSREHKQMRYRPVYQERDISQDYEYRLVEDGPVRAKRLSDDEFRARGSAVGVFRRRPLTSSGFTPSCTYSFDLGGVTCSPFGSGKSWSTNRDGMERLKLAERLFLIGKTPYMKAYFSDFPVTELENVWPDKPGAVGQAYVVQTATKFIERCMLMATDPGDLVLDPTCGSGTTAAVAEQWGRRWITCDTSRVAVTLARTRLMAARYPWFTLADSLEGQKKESEVTGKVPPAFKIEGDIKKGFVYKRVPHVTLKSIANNPDIKEGMTRDQIDAAILRHADTELLFDKPYEDGKRIRVTGPFTVESLSPHRVLSADDERPRSEQEGQRDSVAGQFETMILDNLRKAGVQNTVKNERLVFDRLESLAGTWLHAAGAYTDADGTVRRVAVSIGPEHGTVGPNQVKEAAKEAVLGVGYDVLIVCGFAFDPHVSEEAKRYGKLQVLTARMNPDLSMGDELLKKTGAGNLFMVFGEPDVDIAPVDVDGNLQVTLRGVDVYDPTTGAIRSNSTDDIACWFIDTNYDGESFFVRHAYFTGADEPYEKLKRALRAEIDEAAWSTLYSTVSRPFAQPETGKIAVKVINHYGDEVLKVFVVASVHD